MFSQFVWLPLKMRHTRHYIFEVCVTGDVADDAALLLPDESERIRQISNIYIALRYAPESAGGALDRFVKEVRAFAVHSR